MATFQNHPILAQSTVATAPSPATSGTSVVVAAGEGALFGTGPFQILIWPAGAAATKANAEIATCSSRSTDTFTIVRAQEGTTARSVTVGDQIAAIITGKHFTDIEAASNGLNSATTTVNVSAATAPSTGQALNATSSTTATWQTLASGSVPQHIMTIDGMDASVASRFDASKNVSGTGSLAMGANNNWLEFRTGATSGSYAKVRSHNSTFLSGGGGWLAYPAYWTHILRAASFTGDTGNITFGVGGFDMSSGAVQSYSGYPNYLIKMIVSAGTFTNSYSQSNGSSATTATITISSPSVFTLYTAVLTASNVKYYVDKALVATVSGTLPSGQTDYTGLVMGTGNSASSNDCGFDYYEGTHGLDATS